MRKNSDAYYSDIYICSEPDNWHDFYYIAPESPLEQDWLYKVNRAGIETRTPGLFVVERRERIPFCEIFCILSGSGELYCQSRKYPLHAGQIVLLCANEPHRYQSNSADPMGLAWLEFYGGDSALRMRQIMEKLSPVFENDLFQPICSALCAIQQKLMLDAFYHPSREIYEILYQLMQHCEKPDSSRKRSVPAFAELKTYLDTHLKNRITNRQMAGLCGMSLPVFCRRFQEACRQTPQEYLMSRRIVQAKYALTQTSLSIEEIADQLGFCSASHFIRRFEKSEHITPAKYRTLYHTGT